MIIGAQFYTLREHCKTLDDFAESLKKVADIGYKTVQISGTCAYDPRWLKEQLDNNGLQCVITHTPMDRMLEQPEQVSADHTVFGCKYIGIGCGPDYLKTPADMDKVLSVAHTAGKKFYADGKQLMYHHHAPEFSKDFHDDNGNAVTRLEYLVSHTAPEELGITLDTYWVQAGGADIVSVMGWLCDRIPCIHLKDMLPVHDETHMAPVGSGNLNWEAVLSAAESAGTKFALVEQDNSYGEDPFACLKKSYDYLKAMGLQ